MITDVIFSFQTMLHNLDTSQLEAAERDRGVGVGSDGMTVLNTSVLLGRPQRDIRLAGNFY